MLVVYIYIYSIFTHTSSRLSIHDHVTGEASFRFRQNCHSLKCTLTHIQMNGGKKNKKHNILTKFSSGLGYRMLLKSVRPYATLCGRM